MDREGVDVVVEGVEDVVDVGVDAGVAVDALGKIVVEGEMDVEVAISVGERVAIGEESGGFSGELTLAEDDLMTEAGVGADDLSMTWES